MTMPDMPEQIGLVRIGRAPERVQLTRANLREIADLIGLARHAHVLRVHAEREHCLPALIQSVAGEAVARDLLPKRILERWHDLVAMPATRAALRDPSTIPSH